LWFSAFGTSQFHFWGTSRELARTPEMAHFGKDMKSLIVGLEAGSSWA
jgi:hypothetical protein